MNRVLPREPSPPAPELTSEPPTAESPSSPFPDKPGPCGDSPGNILAPEAPGTRKVPVGRRVATMAASAIVAMRRRRPRGRGAFRRGLRAYRARVHASRNARDGLGKQPTWLLLVRRGLSGPGEGREVGLNPAVPGLGGQGRRPVVPAKRRFRAVRGCTWRKCRNRHSAGRHRRRGRRSPPRPGKPLMVFCGARSYAAMCWIPSQILVIASGMP